MTDISADDPDKALFEESERVIRTQRQADARITVLGADGEPLAAHRVRVRLARHAFLFGAAISLRQNEGAPQEEAYRKAFASLFNYATTENIMKWKPLESKRGMHKWDRADETLAWCERNDIQLKSHCLIWGARQQGVPDWLLNRPRAEVLSLMKERIDTVMKRYRGRIRYYDVVNEPLHCHVFDRIAGPDHLEKVMRWAREADPDACLIVNEYNLIANRRDRRLFGEMMRHLIAEGVPLDGIGIQAHSPGTTWHSPQTIVEALNELAELGKDLHITELTLSTRDKDITGGYRTGKWTDQAHAEYYRQFYTLCFGHPKVKAITIWAVFDSRSWLPGGGIYDCRGRPKAAATALHDLINGRWHTEAELTTGRNGVAQFRGFKGEYDVEVTSPVGETLKKTRLRVGPEASATWRIVVDEKGN